MFTASVAMTLIFDAHLDLAMNAIEGNRDLTQPLAAIRAAEAGLRDKPDRGRGVVCFPEMRRGGVGLCVATLIARVEHQSFSPVFGWRSPAQAWAMTCAQFAWYEAMAEAGQLRPIGSRGDLNGSIDAWSSPVDPAIPPPIGCVISLEGADSILSPAHLERRWSEGLRAIGPAHYGPGVYANGTGAEGGLNRRGRELLQAMDRIGFILDATHLNDECFWQALEVFGGPVWGSHQNCRSLTPGVRQWSDDQIRAVGRRGGVLGVALDAWMLHPGWQRGQTTAASVGLTLERAAEHVDHVCQLTGSANHVGVGSDLDGGFGNEQTPMDVDTIAALPLFIERLRRRGYRDEALARVASGNFIEFLQRALPA